MGTLAERVRFLQGCFLLLRRRIGWEAVKSLADEPLAELCPANMLSRSVDDRHRPALLMLLRLTVTSRRGAFARLARSPHRFSLAAELHADHRGLAPACL